MLKAKQQLLRRLLIGIDIVVVLISFFLAYILRQNVHILYALDFFPEKEVFGDLHALSRYLNILPFLLFAWWAALSSCGLYESFRRKNFFEAVWGIARGAFLVMIVLATVVFIFKLEFVSRTFITLSFFITFSLLVAERWTVVSFLRYLRKKGYNYRNI
ncbi:MAG: sugar transferase, partial [Candidatus Omnitrophica bacterium]|nr:sugar transferase [Candidatus Omnitrophota bacterium]